MAAIEFWLCKVLLHKPTGKPINVSELNERSHQRVLAQIVDGQLGTLPNGDIIEPVEQFASEPLADDARRRRVIDEPHEHWRVVATMEAGK